MDLEKLNFKKSLCKVCFTVTNYDDMWECQAQRHFGDLRSARFFVTCRAIRRACHNLQEPDKNTSDAVDVRQELDLRIGKKILCFFLKDILNRVVRINYETLSYYKK